MEKITIPNTDRKVSLPFYTKVYLSGKEILYCCNKIINEHECINVKKDCIQIAHSGLAFNLPDWQEATKEEFEEFFKQTGQSLTDLAL